MLFSIRQSWFKHLDVNSISHLGDEIENSGQPGNKNKKNTEYTKTDSLDMLSEVDDFTYIISTNLHYIKLALTIHFIL